VTSQFFALSLSVVGTGVLGKYGNVIYFGPQRGFRKLNSATVVRCGPNLATQVQLHGNPCDDDCTVLFSYLVRYIWLSGPMPLPYLGLKYGTLFCVYYYTALKCHVWAAGV